MDACHIAKWLRSADQSEIAAQTTDDPKHVIGRGIESSREAWTLCHTGEPIFVLGVQWTGGATPGDKTGRIWGCGTPGVDFNSRDFLRLSSQFLHHEIDTRWWQLTNVVDERNTAHIRWLQWLGFSFPARIPVYGHQGRPFLYFTRNSSCVDRPSFR